MRAVIAVLELLRPGRVQHGALPLTSDGGGERYGEVRGILFGQHGHGGRRRHQGRRLVPQAGPAEVLSGHDDGGLVGTVIGPALESVEKRHRTNFTVPARRARRVRDIVTA